MSNKENETEKLKGQATMKKTILVKKRLLIKYIVTYFIMIFCMVSLKVLSCYLPANSIKQNIARSVSKMQEEGLSPRMIYSQIPYDNATDAQVLSVCWSSVGEGQTNKLIAAIDNIEYSYPGDTDAVNWLCNLVQYASDGEALHVVRHWMGITVPLKILFIFFDYTQIRLVIMLILFGLSFEITRMVYNYDKYLSVAFFISLVAIDLASAFLTVNSYSMILLTFIALVYYLKHKNETMFDEKLFLFTIGGLTSYFDLMSAPVMTYLYSVIFMLILSKENKRCKQTFTFLVKTGISWLAGYIAVWIIQWGLSSIVLNENIFLNAVNEMSRMVDGKILEWLPEGKMERILAAIGLNKGVLLTSYLINDNFFIITLIMTGILFWMIRKDREKLYTYFMLLIVGIIPFGWFVVANNQSLIFYNLSFRILGGTVMVIVYFMCQCYGEIRKKYINYKRSK